MASYKNTIGAAELVTVWSDPEFDPGARAFYYARVLQIPTPRNSLYDSVALQKPPPEGLPTAIQERAYSSPIWYSPSKGLSVGRKSGIPGFSQIRRDQPETRPSGDPDLSPEGLGANCACRRSPLRGMIAASDREAISCD
jgi:hypothetical protein